MRMTVRKVLVMTLTLFLLFRLGWAGEETDKTIITAEMIEKMNVHKIFDLLNHIPGVKAGESSVSIRGSYKVRVILDGRSIVDPTSSYGGIKWGLVSLKNVEKIEIYKGEGGVEFGDDSSGGVIVITTKKIESFHGNVESYLGNLGTESYSTNCQGDSGPLGVNVSLAYESTEGFRTNGDKEKFRGGGKIQYTLDKDCFFVLSGDYLSDERGLPGLPQYPTPNSRKDQELQSYLFLAVLWDIKSRTYLSDAETENSDPDRSLDVSIMVKKVGEDISAEVPMGRWGSLNCGAGFEWARALGNQFDSQREEKYWLFASKGFSLKPIPITLTCGLRSNSYSEYEEVLNPEFKVRYQRDSYALQFSVNQTNNVPSFYQRYNETSSTIPNPDLTMEKAENYSLLFYGKPCASFSGSISPFFNKITDRITYVRGDDGIGQYENFGKVTYKGVELSLNWKISEPVLIKTSYIYLEAKDEDTGNYIACKAKHQANTDIIFTPMERLSMILNGKYTSRTYARSDNSESVPEYFLVDFRSEYGFTDVSIFCEVKNIFDKGYFYVDAYPGPPRRWVAGLNYNF